MMAEYNATLLWQREQSRTVELPYALVPVAGGRVRLLRREP